MTDEERTALAEYDRLIAAGRAAMKHRRALLARVRMRQPKPA
jgi:hypothetical protein